MATVSRDFQVCEACNLVVRPAYAFAAHSASREHLERVQGNFVHCSVCAISFLRGNWVGHIGGQNHRNAASSQGLRANLPFEIPTVVPDHRKCNICKIFIYNSDWHQHINAPAHTAQLRAREEIATLRETVRRATGDRDGVMVSRPDGVDLGVVDLVVAAQGTRNTHLIVTTTAGQDSIMFIKATIRPSSGLTSSTSYVQASSIFDAV
jgi:hypothetical protein